MSGEKYVCFRLEQFTIPHIITSATVTAKVQVVPGGMGSKFSIRGKKFFAPKYPIEIFFPYDSIYGKEIKITLSEGKPRPREFSQIKITLDVFPPNLLIRNAVEMCVVNPNIQHPTCFFSIHLNENGARDFRVPLGTIPNQQSLQDLPETYIPSSCMSSATVSKQRKLDELFASTKTMDSEDVDSNSASDEESNSESESEIEKVTEYPFPSYRAGFLEDQAVEAIPPKSLESTPVSSAFQSKEPLGDCILDISYEDKKENLPQIISLDNANMVSLPVEYQKQESFKDEEDENKLESNKVVYGNEEVHVVELEQKENNISDQVEEIVHPIENVQPPPQTRSWSPFQSIKRSSDALSAEEAIERKSEKITIESESSVSSELGFGADGTTESESSEKNNEYENDIPETVNEQPQELASIGISYGNLEQEKPKEEPIANENNISKNDLPSTEETTPTLRLAYPPPVVLGIPSGASSEGFEVKPQIEAPQEKKLPSWAAERSAMPPFVLPNMYEKNSSYVPLQPMSIPLYSASK